MIKSDRELLSQARVALEQNQGEVAQGILVNLVVEQPRNEEAWVLLAQTFSDLDRKMECIQRARQANPFSSLIAEAVEQIKSEILQSAFSETKTPVPVSASETSNPALARALLEAADALAKATVMTTEPMETRDFGAELVLLLERAHLYEPILTRRWTNSAGRTALVKYERALTLFIVNLPQNDPQVTSLRELRQRALDLFK